MKTLQYQFTDDCMIGIEQIDEEHRKLFSLVNEAMEALQCADAEEKTVVELICKQMGCKKETVLPQSSLVNDIGCDSLDIVDLLMDIEKRMGISIYDVADTHFFDRPETTVADACRRIHQWINQAYGKAEQ